MMLSNDGEKRAETDVQEIGEILQDERERGLWDYYIL